MLHTSESYFWLGVGMALLGLILLSGCAPRCETRPVPVTWAQGTTTTVTLTVCGLAWVDRMETGTR
jgi:hypothetical protein